MSAAFSEARQWLDGVTSPGRKIGAVEGAWVSDIASLRKAITLCQNCSHKFAHRAHHYFREDKVKATGMCDGCRDNMARCTLYMPEELLGNTWTPR